MKTIREKFTELAKEYGEVRSYSGRGMLGKQTIGVTLERSFVDEFKRLCNESGINISSDSMGLDTIVYVSNPKDLDEEAEKTIEEILEEHLEKIENALNNYCYTPYDFHEVKELIQDLRKDFGI